MDVSVFFRKCCVGVILCMLVFAVGCSSDDSGGSSPTVPAPNVQPVQQRIAKGNFVFEKNDAKTCSLVEYTGSDSVVVIPSKVEDFIVTAIGKTDGSGKPVFKNHSEISRAMIPYSIHYIAAESFMGTGLVEALIPGHVYYIGKDCFKDCKKLTVIVNEAAYEALHGWDSKWNPDGIQTVWDQPIENDGSAIEFVAKKIVGSFVSKGVEKVADIAINSILSAFGYKDPEAQFQEATLKTLADIQNAITKDMGELSQKIKQIDDKITELGDYLTGMEREIFAKVDRTEFDTRMTVVGKDVSTIDTLYDKYMRAIANTDYAVADAAVKQLVSDLQGADLLSMINYLQSEMTGSAAGSQTPIVTLYCTYLKEVYPFMHEVYDRLSNFAKYYQMEMLKAVQLYTEFANYQQALNSGESASRTVWEQNSAAALKSFNDSLDAIDKLLPQGDFTLKTDDTTYHIITSDDSVNFYFTSNLKDCESIISEEDDGDAYNRYYYTWWTTVEHDDYNKLNGIRVKYDAASSLLDFINKNTGAGIQTQLWGCKSELYNAGNHRWLCCPCIKLDDLDAQRQDCYVGQFVPVWK